MHFPVMLPRSRSRSQALRISPVATRRLSSLLPLLLILAVPRFGATTNVASSGNIVDESWYTRGVPSDPRPATDRSVAANAVAPAQSSLDACRARTAAYLNESGPRPPFPTLCPSEGLFEVCDVKGPIAFNITPKFIGTRWKGWGTSLAWFANYIGGLPEKHLGRLMDLMFTRDGLNFNIVRYNIGGGFNARFSPQFLSKTIADWRGVPGFKPTQTGAYDWQADKRQKTVLWGARSRGANIFEAFSNSPPWWMTITRDVAGATDPTKTNLRPEYESSFAQYLAAVVENFAKDPKWNLTFTSVEPFNEPLEGFWKAGAPHEGCTFKAPEMGRVIQKTAMALKSRGLKTKLVGVDSWSPYTTAFVSKFASANMLQRINVHSYTGTPPEGVSLPRWTNLQYARMRNVAKRLRKEVWVSEGGPIGYEGHPYDVTLYVARQVIESINILEASAYVYWQAIDPHPAWTLIKIPWGYPLKKAAGEIQQQGILLAKRYWVFRQFAKFAPQGSRPLRVPYSCWHSVAAFYNEKYSFVSVFFVNQKAKTVKLKFGLDQFRTNVGNPTRVIGHRTTWKDSYAEALIAKGKSSVTITLEGQSFMSLVFTNIALKKGSLKK
ncbi:hypothetical protein CLOM_g3960 [Closterium sp. NIES-68]|nr:hypothetical protein CLOM_g3960 [Closterium sp. NIES-68]GJP85901.1 hypothetical protein CLOP_g15995 [Closterium sp. NIES-67]